MIKLNKKELALRDSNGFTLIELLVVIAIIGILASIVLVSLNDARNKGYDTQIKSDVAQLRNQIELCYDNNNGTYVGCTTASADVDTLTPPSCAGGAATAYVITVTATNYAVSNALCSDTTKYWCVDNQGNVGIGADFSQGGTCKP